MVLATDRLLATQETCQVPNFASPLPSDDIHIGLIINWAQWVYLYAFPPIALLPELLLKFARTPGWRHLILVLPDWPRKPWFKEALRWSIHLNDLPNVPSLLSQSTNPPSFSPSLVDISTCATYCYKSD